MITNSSQKEMIEVLMVEDNPDDIELALEAFKESSKGFNVNVALDGKEAMAYLRREGEFFESPRPDLILLDLNMPRMNGFEVLEEINKDADLKNIPVVVFSISQNEDDIAKVNSLNVKTYIVKPIGLDGLLKVVKQLEEIIGVH